MSAGTNNKPDQPSKLAKLILDEGEKIELDQYYSMLDRSMRHELADELVKAAEAINDAIHNTIYGDYPAEVGDPRWKAAAALEENADVKELKGIGRMPLRKRLEDFMWKELINLWIRAFKLVSEHTEMRGKVRYVAES